MTEKQVEYLQKEGINPEELSKNIALMYLLSDMAEIYTVAVHTALKSLNRNNHDRLTIEKISRLSKALTRSTARALGNEPLMERFGDTSDFLQVIIEKALYIDTAEGRKRLIEAMEAILNGSAE